MKKATLLFLFLSLVTLAQKPVFVNAKVKSATVYFNAAELNQNVQLNALPVGTNEIVIKNVANDLLENTVKIAAPSSVTILSIQFTNDYISEYELDETSPHIKQIRDSINYLNKEIQKTQNALATEEKLLSVLEKNQQISGEKSTLSVIELTKLIDYQKLKNNEILNNINTLNEKIQKLSLKIENLNQKLEINTQKEEQIANGKLIIRLMNEVAGNVSMDINYLTNSASWTPFYELRANSVKESIDMVYKAQVVQNTGVDWKKVKLTLSSGNPNQNNEAPLLNAWFLRYGNPYKKYAINPSQNAIKNTYTQDVKSEVSQKIVVRGNATFNNNNENEALVVIDDVISTQQVLKELPSESIKSINVLKGAQATALYGSQGGQGVIIVRTKNMDDYTSVQENELNISFDIDIPYDVLSNGKAHSVTLKNLQLPAEYQYYTVPKANKDAFLLANINEYAKYNLLPGEANIVFENLYVGKTYINPNQTTDLLSLSMGTDKKILVKREKVIDKSGTKFFSSYQEQIFTYDITLRNNKKEAIEIRVKDQYPISTDNDITVELLEKSGATDNPETGILTWQIKLQSNESKKVRISYKVKYPKDKTIENL